MNETERPDLSQEHYRFDLLGAPLDQSLAIATGGLVGHQVSAWRVEKNPNRLVLCWMQKNDSTALPAPLKGEAIVSFVRSWLDSVEYGREPDTDGSTEKSWRVYNESWGHVGGDFYAFAAVEPAWLVYGK